ncbi:MAG: hypothetical protein PHI32_15650 [Dysgonamonadaceae bacterium]|nr:hypothetical protein [Dysgonamonadaceae bacterium]MDD4729751.1 hypothetical protein [Dysgonamonadaceae bacterium]
MSNTPVYSSWFTGKSERVNFRAKKYILQNSLTGFGKEMSFSNETEEEVTVSVIVNLQACVNGHCNLGCMFRAPSPKKLVEEVEEDLKGNTENYK